MRALLLSGGMDSIAVAHWKKPDVAITIDYGQVCAEAELRAAGEVARALNIPNEVLRIDCRSLGSGDLAGSGALSLAATSEWWPYRNQLLLTLAAMKAVTLGAQELMIATVISDGNYRDGTPQFVDRIDALLSYQEGNVRVTAPAISLTSVELVRTSGVPFSLLAWAHSCHRANLACGSCRGCYKHQDSMYALGHGHY